jgi:restriction system protein
LGYLVSLTPDSYDGGVDIIAKKRDEPDLYIQCKGWIGNIGVKIVREMAGIVSNKSNAKAIIITTSDFTVEAKKEASTFNVELIGLSKLIYLINLANSYQK